VQLDLAVLGELLLARASAVVVDACLVLVERAFGFMRIHSSSRSRNLPRAFSLLLQLHALGASLEVLGVVALVGMQAAGEDLEHPADDAVEEEAIVRDDDDRALVARERLLEPRDRLDVEVVGRLVEQQDVGVLEQRAAQRDAATLASRQLAHVDVAAVAGAAWSSRSRRGTSRFHASFASISFCTRSSSARTRFMSFSERSVASFSLSAPYCSIRSRTGLTASSTFSRTVSVSSSFGSCGT
jgi:hypothetical protein